MSPSLHVCFCTCICIDVGAAEHLELHKRRSPSPPPPSVHVHIAPSVLDKLSAFPPAPPSYPPPLSRGGDTPVISHRRSRDSRYAYDRSASGSIPRRGDANSPHSRHNRGDLYSRERRSFSPGRSDEPVAGFREHERSLRNRGGRAPSNPSARFLANRNDLERKDNDNAVRRRDDSPPMRRRDSSLPVRRRDDSPPVRRRDDSPPMRRRDESSPVRRRDRSPLRGHSPAPIERRRNDIANESSRDRSPERPAVQRRGSRGGNNHNIRDDTSSLNLERYLRTTHDSSPAVRRDQAPRERPLSGRQAPRLSGSPPASSEFSFPSAAPPSYQSLAPSVASSPPSVVPPSFTTDTTHTHALPRGGVGMMPMRSPNYGDLHPSLRPGGMLNTGGARRGDGGSMFSFEPPRSSNNRNPRFSSVARSLASPSIPEMAPPSYTTAHNRPSLDDLGSLPPISPPSYANSRRTSAAPSGNMSPRVHLRANASRPAPPIQSRDNTQSANSPRDFGRPNDGTRGVRDRDVHRPPRQSGTGNNESEFSRDFYTNVPARESRESGNFQNRERRDISVASQNRRDGDRQEAPPRRQNKSDWRSPAFSNSYQYGGRNRMQSGDYYGGGGGRSSDKNREKDVDRDTGYDRERERTRERDRERRRRDHDRDRDRRRSHRDRDRYESDESSNSDDDADYERERRRRKRRSDRRR